MICCCGCRSFILCNNIFKSWWGVYLILRINMEGDLDEEWRQAIPCFCSKCFIQISFSSPEGNIFSGERLGGVTKSVLVCWWIWSSWKLKMKWVVTKGPKPEILIQIGHDLTELGCIRSFWRYPKSLIDITHDLTELGTWRMLMVPDWRLEDCGHLWHLDLCFREGFQKRC